MLYCEICKDLVEGHCEHRDHPNPRPPLTNDPVLLMSAPTIEAGMAEGLLEEAGIPCMKQGELGAGLTAWTGDMLELYHLYVPYGALDKAREAVQPITAAQEAEEAEAKDELVEQDKVEGEEGE